MPTKRNYILLLIVIIMKSTNLLATNDYGLLFKSYDYPANERTSLILNNRNPFKVKDSFSIEFNLYIRGKAKFGNILNFQTNSNKEFNLILSADDNDVFYPVMSDGSHINTIMPSIKINEWLPVTIAFNRDNNTIDIFFDKVHKTIHTPLQDLENILPVFGVNNHSDIASFNIKDVKIKTENRLLKYWKLYQHNDNICLDEVDRTPAIAKNPVWLIDNHLNWQEIFSKKSHSCINIAFNSKNAHFYIKEHQKLNVIDGNTGDLINTLTPVNDLSLEYQGHLLYDTLTNRLFSYSLYDKKAVYYSFEDNKWYGDTKLNEIPHFNNHSCSFNPEDSTFYFLGGYGFYKWGNEMFKLKATTGEITKFNYSPRISPRSTSSSCILDNNLYLFGGIGNKDGRQEFEYHYYHDFQIIDLNTGKSKVLWNKESSNQSSVMASSMYFEPADSTFYAASLDNGGTLWKISLKDSTIIEISKPIKNTHTYQDIEFNLYHSAQYQKFFLVIDKISSLKEHDIKIYSIKQPFLSSGNIQLTNKTDKITLSIYFTIGIIIIILCFISLTIYVQINKKKNSTPSHVDMGSSDVQEEILDSKEICSSKDEEEDDADENEDVEPINVAHFERGKSCISLLGTFNAKDNKGYDITHLFTPKLKELLIQIILYSEKRETGVNTKTILETLWPDKEENSAKNNLNVNLRKLRLLVETIGNAEIINESGFLRIEWHENIFCDYRTAISLYKEFTEQKINDREFINRIIECLLWGPLLTNTHYEWLDDFKEHYSSMSIDLLINLLSLKLQNEEMALQIADIIFLHDPLNEEALATKCSILSNQGKKGLAMKAYNRFCEEYKKSLGEDYQIPLSNLLK